MDKASASGARDFRFKSQAAQESLAHMQFLGDVVFGSPRNETLAHETATRGGTETTLAKSSTTRHSVLNVYQPVWHCLT
eukprot:4565518-Amphidinium_carterae.1